MKIAKVSLSILAHGLFTGFKVRYDGPMRDNRRCYYPRCLSIISRTGEMDRYLTDYLNSAALRRADDHAVTPSPAVALTGQSSLFSPASRPFPTWRARHPIFTPSRTAAASALSLFSTPVRTPLLFSRHERKRVPRNVGATRARVRAKRERRGRERDAEGRGERERARGGVARDRATRGWTRVDICIPRARNSRGIRSLKVPGRGRRKMCTQRIGTLKRVVLCPSSLSLSLVSLVVLTFPSLLAGTNSTRMLPEHKTYKR